MKFNMCSDIGMISALQMEIQKAMCLQRFQAHYQQNNIGT